MNHSNSTKDYFKNKNIVNVVLPDFLSYCESNCDLCSDPGYSKYIVSEFAVVAVKRLEKVSEQCGVVTCLRSVRLTVCVRLGGGSRGILSESE